MRILLLGNPYAPEPTGIALYSAGLAEALARKGHQVRVVCANPSYPHWRLFDGYRAWRWSRSTENGVEIHRCPVYIPAKVSGLKRMLHYGSYVMSSMPVVLTAAIRFRPDAVILVVPTLLAAPVALVAARIAKAVSWLHVQDFEVEAGFATGQMQGGSRLGALALRFERGSIAAFDQTSSISPEMCAKLVEKAPASATPYELRNWAAIDSVTPRPTSTFRDHWNIATPHVAIYSGSIAKKQGIETIVETARLLRDRKDLTFIICGNGPTRPDLEAAAADLANIQFHDLQPMEDLGELLNLATIHLLPQKRDAADLVLPSKLTNMLASGRPVVAGAAAGCGLAREVEGCGLAVEPEDAPAMAAGITRLLDDPALYADCAREARKRAEERWAPESIIDRFEQKLCDLVARRRGTATKARAADDRTQQADRA